MAQKKQAAKKAATQKPVAKRARNKDGTYKGDNKSTPDVNEAYDKKTKPGTKATTKPRNPAAKQREAATKKSPAKPAAVKKRTYAPKVQKAPPTPKPKTKIEDLWRSTPTTPVKKTRIAKMWTWLVGE